jgi:xanthine dehydrogenase YagS FAD-binding subunit
MRPFRYERAEDASGAVAAVAGHPEAAFLGGGTNLVDHMKLGIAGPELLVDVTRLGNDAIEPLPDGGVRIGAAVRNSVLAASPLVRERYPVLSHALLAGASGQLRNLATTGGNLLQRTRCVYFRDTAMACNKREPGTGCPAINGFNRSLGILGTSEHCIATNPSDMCVAMAALEATIHVQGPKATRAIPFGEFHVLPGDTPHRETVLEPGDLVTHVTLPAPSAGSTSTYLKLRDRASYEFALTSAAIVVTTTAGRFDRVRVAMGGVGTKPWRMLDVERALTGKSVSEETIRTVAAAALGDAKPQSRNGFKVELGRRCLAQALRLATGLAHA